MTRTFVLDPLPRRVPPLSTTDLTSALFAAIDPGQEVAAIGGDEAAMRAAGFEILSCPVPEAVRVCKPPAPAAKEDP